MAYYNKIGLLVLNSSHTKFLVCQKAPENVTADYIMPGGQFTENSAEECLKNEIKEELGCEVDFSTLQKIGIYTDVAAGDPNHDVSIELYSAKLLGVPKPSAEVKSIYWIGKEAVSNSKISPVIRNKIISDLVKRGILK